MKKNDGNDDNKKNKNSGSCIINENCLFENKLLAVKSCPICSNDTTFQNTASDMIRILNILTKEFELKDFSNILVLLNGIDGYEREPTICIDDDENEKLLAIENREKQKCTQGEKEEKKRKRDIDTSSERRQFVWKNVDCEYSREIDSLVLTCSNVCHISKEVFQNDKIDINGRNDTRNIDDDEQKIRDQFILIIRDILSSTKESREAKRRKYNEDQKSYNLIITQLIENLN